MNRIEGLFAAMRAAGQHMEWQGRAALAGYAEQLSQALCQYFQCTHASLWVLDGEAGRHRLRCLGRHEVDGVSDQSPLCEQRMFPAYFEALLGDGVFACADTRTDLRAVGLADRGEPSWRAMLDVCGQINGKTVGVIALGQRSEAREWTKAEELDLRRATAKACLHLHGLRRELEAV